MRSKSPANWWKSASTSEEQYDAMFDKLMTQYGQREDQANQMLGLLLSDRAPSWFVKRLEEWVVKNKLIPESHWTNRWIAHRLQGSSGKENELRMMVKYLGFTGVTYQTWNWMKNWCDGLSPDSEPSWFGEEVIRFLDRHHDLPGFTYKWAEAKLERGQDDDVRRALHDTVIRSLEKVKKYRSDLRPKSMDWHLIPSWGRDYAKKIFHDQTSDGGEHS